MKGTARGLCPRCDEEWAEPVDKPLDANGVLQVPVQCKRCGAFFVWRRPMGMPTL